MQLVCAGESESQNYPMLTTLWQQQWTCTCT